jgi:hypothetical protein
MTTLGMSASGNKYPIFSAAFKRSIHDSAVQNVEDDNKGSSDLHLAKHSHQNFRMIKFKEY